MIEEEFKSKGLLADTSEEDKLLIPEVGLNWLVLMETLSIGDVGDTILDCNPEDLDKALVADKISEVELEYL